MIMIRITIKIQVQFYNPSVQPMSPPATRPEFPYCAHSPYRIR